MHVNLNKNTESISEEILAMNKKKALWKPSEYDLHIVNEDFFDIQEYIILNIKRAVSQTKKANQI